jgi:hypothetical protein
MAIGVILILHPWFLLIVFIDLDGFGLNGISISGDLRLRRKEVFLVAFKIILISAFNALDFSGHRTCLKTLVIPLAT